MLVVVLRAVQVHRHQGREWKREEWKDEGWRVQSEVRQLKEEVGEYMLVFISVIKKQEDRKWCNIHLTVNLQYFMAVTSLLIITDKVNIASSTTDSEGEVMTVVNNNHWTVGGHSRHAGRQWKEATITRFTVMVMKRSDTRLNTRPKLTSWLTVLQLKWSINRVYHDITSTFVSYLHVWHSHTRNLNLKPVCHIQLMCTCCGCFKLQPQFV